MVVREAVCDICSSNNSSLTTPQLQLVIFESKELHSSVAAGTLVYSHYPSIFYYTLNPLCPAPCTVQPVYTMYYCSTCSKSVSESHTQTQTDARRSHSHARSPIDKMSRLRCLSDDEKYGKLFKEKKKRKEFN